MNYTPAERGEIKADITNMYRAGKFVLPDRAADLKKAAELMKSAIDTADSRSAQLGDCPALIDVLDMSSDCQIAVARAVTTLNNMALGVVAIADDFVARDSYAREVFNGLSEGLRDTPVHVVPPPEETNKESNLNDGDGDEYTANPDVATPDDEKQDRDDQLSQAEDQNPFPTDGA